MTETGQEGRPQEPESAQPQEDGGASAMEAPSSGERQSAAKTDPAADTPVPEATGAPSGAAAEEPAGEQDAVAAETATEPAVEDSAPTETPAEATAEPEPEEPHGPTLDTMKPGCLIKNLRDEQIFKVIGLSGKKIHARDLMGAERTYMFLGQFEWPSEDDATAFERDRVKPVEPKVNTVKPEISKKETDAFSAYLESIRQLHASDADRFEAFWKQSLEIFGDEPSQTWRIRVNRGLQPSPTLRLRSIKTNRWRDAVMLWGQEKLTIIIAKTVCPEKDRELCRDLFPDDNESYGKGISTTIPYSELDEDKQKSYLECFRTIMKAFGA